MKPVAQMTHEDWQQLVVDAARVFGWQHLHVRRTRGQGGQWTTSTNRKGWPDLFLWHPRHGFAAIELKVGKDKVTPEQAAVIAELHLAGANVLVAYPADWFDVEQLLRGRRKAAA